MEGFFSNLFSKNKNIDNNKIRGTVYKKEEEANNKEKLRRLLILCMKQPHKTQTLEKILEKCIEPGSAIDQHLHAFYLKYGFKKGMKNFLANLRERNVDGDLLKEMKKTLLEYDARQSTQGEVLEKIKKDLKSATSPTEKYFLEELINTKEPVDTYFSGDGKILEALSDYGQISQDDDWIELTRLQRIDWDTYLDEMENTYRVDLSKEAKYCGHIIEGWNVGKYRNIPNRDDKQGSEYSKWWLVSKELIKFQKWMKDNMEKNDVDFRAAYLADLLAFTVCRWYLFTPLKEIGSKSFMGLMGAQNVKQFLNDLAKHVTKECELIPIYN